jgi:hypothetical protein
MAADKDKPASASASEGGVAGKHNAPPPFEVLLGPSTGSEFNTARLPLAPVACFRVDDIRFAFDSSFIAAETDEKNDVRSELKLLAELLGELPGSPLSVFGHADPVGDDVPNKILSGRRARIVYALIISNKEPDLALKMWQDVAAEEKWGASQRQNMETTTGLPHGTSDKDLMKAYMKVLSPPDLQVGKTDFLAQGADSKGKGDFQGCSEFNPVLIFSEKKNKELEGLKDKTPRNDANAPNRRVIVLLFPKGSRVEPSKWPCPSAAAGIGDCLAQFHKDGDKRRKTRQPERDRKFEDAQADPAKGTFACAFYDQLLTSSPCEKALSIVKIRLFDAQARALPFGPCLVTLNGRTTADRATGPPPSPLGKFLGSPPGSGSTPSGGTKEDGFIKIRVLDFPATVNVKWSRPKEGEGSGAPLPGVDDPDDFEFEMDVTVNIPDDESEAASKLRLKNLGYDGNPPKPIVGLEDPIRAFQTDYKAKFADIVVDGTLNPPTAKAVRTVHDACDPVLKSGSQVPLTR